MIYCPNMDMATDINQAAGKAVAGRGFRTQSGDLVRYPILKDNRHYYCLDARPDDQEYEIVPEEVMVHRLATGPEKDFVGIYRGKAWLIAVHEDGVTVQELPKERPLDL